MAENLQFLDFTQVKQGASKLTIFFFGLARGTQDTMLQCQ